MGKVPMCPTYGKNHSRECWKNMIDIRCFHYNKLGHIKRNCPRLRIGAIVPRGGQRGGNGMPGRNHLGNQGNRGSHGNDQRQGHVFTLMLGDTRNNEVVV